MILNRVFMLPQKLTKPMPVSAPPEYLLEPLNEIKAENIKYLVGIPGLGGLLGYVVFFEDENIYACPKCGHHISNTFSFCPNCAHKMDPGADAPLKCPTCNNDVAYTFKHCPECGTKLK